MTAVDLRSDTVTKPTPAMRRAMAEAEVGDDVYGEDPTVNRLQARAAEIFEREAALFVPSGSMGNLIAIKTWARPTNEVICEQRGHVNLYELASMSAIAGCMPRTTPAPGGILTWELIEPLIRPKIYYDSQTALVALENTHNMHGGTVYPHGRCGRRLRSRPRRGPPRASRRRAHFQRRRCSRPQRRRADPQIRFRDVLPLERARRARRLDASRFTRFHRPGSHRRKLLGGGMRQAGVLAAAGLVALEETPKILHRDHENARHLAEGLAQINGISIDPKKVVTNIVIFDVEETGFTAVDICAELAKHQIRCGDTAKYSVRMVTHYDVDRAGHRPCPRCDRQSRRRPRPCRRSALGESSEHICGRFGL